MSDSLDHFMVRAVLAGLGTALAAAPLGCFVVWRRMAYFGDATAHAAILGVALALALAVHVFAAVLAVALAIGLALSALTARGHAADTALGVLSHAALALGLVAVSLLGGAQVDLMAWLFGDILAVSRQDVVVIGVGAAAVLALLAVHWQGLLMATLNPDLAFASGIDPRRQQLILTLAIALVVMVAIKVVGALLIGALLIIPAAAARPLARTPEGMAAGAALIGTGAVAAGLAGSWHLDTPAGPSIVVAAALVFVVTTALGGTPRRV